jgi:HK97 family phage major capsid protein
MKKLLELKERRKETLAKMEALVESDEITAEIQEQIDGFNAELDTIDDKIANCNKLIERVNSTPPDSILKDIPRAEEAKDEGIDFTSIEVPWNTRGIHSLKCYKTPEAQKRAFALGQQIRAMHGIQSAVQWCADNGLTPIGAVHNENTNTQGGYLVLPEFDRDIIVLEEQYGVFQRLARTVPMGSDRTDRDRKTGGLTMYAVGESDAGTESTASWDQVTLRRKDWMVLTRITNQLSADSIINVVDFLAQDVARASALKKDQAGFIGDGTSTYHGIEGINTKLVTINAVDNGGGLVLGAGNAASEITLANFESMIGALPIYPGMSERWITSKWVWANVMLRLAAASGGNDISAIDKGSEGRSFLGIPVEISQVFPSSDANSQILCLLGDVSLSSDFGDRQSTTIAFSDSASVGGQSVFERNQRAVRWTEAWDINVHDLGTATAAGPVVGLISAAS